MVSFFYWIVVSVSGELHSCNAGHVIVGLALVSVIFSKHEIGLLRRASAQ